MSGPVSKPRVDPARLAAYDVLVAVRADDAYANLVLPRLLRERGIGGRDAAFATELVGGTLRGLGSYDAIVDHLASRPPDPAVRDALRLGAHQLLALRVPDHAAVTSTVELVRARVGHRPAGFTNALMRRIAARDLESWFTELDAPPATCGSPTPRGSWTPWPRPSTGPTSSTGRWPPTTSGPGSRWWRGRGSRRSPSSRRRSIDLRRRSRRSGSSWTG